jgi:hypothetical protein
MFALAIQRGINDLVLPFRPAPNDCAILFAKPMSLHHEPKISRSRRGFCNQNQSAGFPVESVHNRNLSAAGDIECEQVTQLFPESWRIAGLCRMNQKKRRLVDDDVVIGLIDDFKVERKGNRVMESRTCLSSKPRLSPVAKGLHHFSPCLTFRCKTALS